MPPPLVIARSAATGQSVLLAAAQNEKQYFGRIRSFYEFALRITSLPSFSAGTRIAAPVCALVRNDMQKTETRLRLQGRGDRQKAGAFLRVQGGAAG